MRKILVVADAPTAEQVGRVVKGLLEKISDPKLNAQLDEAVAGMPTEKEVIAYAQGGDVYIGRRPVQSLASWKKYGQEKKYKYLYKGFAYHGNERAQVVVFDDKTWDAQEIQRRKTNGFLGIHFYDLTTGEDRQVTEDVLASVAAWKRKMVPGTKLVLVSRDGQKLNQSREVTEVTSNGVAFKGEGIGGKGISWLAFPKASHIKFIDNGFEVGGLVYKFVDGESVAESEVSDVVMGRRVSYTPIFLHKDAESLKEKIKEGLSAPWKQVQYSTLGGDERGSFLIAVSLDKKENWQNGYLENSRYARFHLSNTGELENFSGSGMGRFRKSRVKDVDSAIAKINSFIEGQAKSKSMSESEEINVGDTVKVDMGVVTKYDNLPQYLGLVRAAIKNGGGRVEVADIENGKAEIVGGPREKFLGGPWVPIEALRKMGATLAGGGESHGAGGFAT